MSDNKFWQEFEGFPGFQQPGYTQMPDIFFDKLMAHLKESETKVLLSIFRHTFGFGKDIDAISVSQLQKDTGLVKQTIYNATASLEEKGLILVERRRDEKQRRMVNRYQVRFRREPGKEIPTVAQSDIQEISRTRNNYNENEGPSVSSQSINNNKTALIRQLHAEFAQQDNPTAIQTYLGRFPAALITRAAEITRASDNTHKPIAYLYGVLQRLQEQKSYLPAAQRHIEALPELTDEEYQASLQALDRIKQQVSAAGDD